MEEFVTADSGKREVFETGMKRDTQNNKPRFDLLTPLTIPFERQMLTRWANLMARGVIKYEARNWEKAKTQDELDRYVASAERHLQQWKAQILGYGFVNKEQDKEDHAAAVMFNIQGAETVKWRIENKK